MDEQKEYINRKMDEQKKYINRKMDEQKEYINRKLDAQFEDLNRDMKEQIHNFEAKVEGSFGLCEGLDEIGGINMAASSSRGCAEGEETVCDPLGEEQFPDDQQHLISNVEVESEENAREEGCREQETEEVLVEDMEDRGEVDLGGTKECMEQETEEDLVEDVEDKGELDLVDGDDDDRRDFTSD